MITEEVINGKVFVVQTTYYVYESEQDRAIDRFSICTADKGVFDAIKKEETRLANRRFCNCGGELIELPTTYGDPEGIRHDSQCDKCGQVWGQTKAMQHKINTAYYERLRQEDN